MPAKKAAPQKAESGGMGDIWKWVFVVGAIVAGLAGAFSFQNQILTWILILAGVLVGLLWRSTDDLTGFGIRYLLLFAVAKALDAVPAVGPILSGFFTGFVGFLGPVALATLVMYFVRKYFMGMM